MLHLSMGQKMTLSFAAKGGPKASASQPLARSSPLQNTEEPDCVSGLPTRWGYHLLKRAAFTSEPCPHVYYQLASTFQLGSSCCQFSWKKFPISWSFSKEKTKKKKEGEAGTWTGRCFGSGFVSVESHKEQSPRDCFL